MVEDNQVTGESGLGEYNKVVITKNVETIDAFSSHVIPMKMKRAVMSEPLVMTQLLGGGEESHTSQLPRLIMIQRHGKLLEELDLSGLASWPPELADSAQSLLMEYHDVFLLELGKLGCTHSTKHIIKVTDDTPFKEQFRQIPPPLVEEVHTHL